jgi:hypothetical protein
MPRFIRMEIHPILWLTKTIDKKYLALIPKGKKRNTIVQFAKELEKEGKIPQDKISSHIVEVFREYAQKDYVRECLDRKYKVKYRVDNAQKRGFSRVSHAKQAQVQHELEKPITTREEDSDQIARQRQVYRDHQRHRRLLNEEHEFLRLEIERREKINNKVDWDNLNWLAYAAVDSYTEEECRVLLEEAFRRFMGTKVDLNWYKGSYESLLNQLEEMSRRFKICVICHKNKGKREYRDGLLCDKCYKNRIEIDKKANPMVARVLKSVMGQEKNEK